MKNAAPDLLTGLQVLLVEDQSLIALDTEMLLRELGARTVETFTSAEAALTWLAASSPDVSVLDINLGTTTSFAIADEIHRRAKPFIFTTGYDDGIEIPEAYRGIGIARKPYTRDALARTLAACLRREASA